MVKLCFCPKDLEISISQARNFIDSYFENYNGVSEYIDSLKELCRAQLCGDFSGSTKEHYGIPIGTSLHGNMLSGWLKHVIRVGRI